jgi:hypothetical protein
MVDFSSRAKIDILLCVGGDGTQKGSLAIAEEIARRGLPISVVGIPKTIDNDIQFVRANLRLLQRHRIRARDPRRRPLRIQGRPQRHRPRQGHGPRLRVHRRRRRRRLAGSQLRPRARNPPAPRWPQGIPRRPPPPHHRPPPCRRRRRRRRRPGPDPRRSGRRQIRQPRQGRHRPLPARPHPNLLCRPRHRGEPQVHRPSYVIRSVPPIRRTPGCATASPATPSMPPWPAKPDSSSASGTTASSTSPSRSPPATAKPSTPKATSGKPSSPPPANPPTGISPHMV